MRLVILLFLLAFIAVPAMPEALAASRTEMIKTRGSLTCGIVDRVRGFTNIESDGRVSGFEPDLCRAVAVAVLGRDAKVTYMTADSVQSFIESGEPDVVARRLTVTLRRDLQPGLTFSRVIFFDGTALLVPVALQEATPSALAGHTICVRGESEADHGLSTYFARRQLTVAAFRTTDLKDATDAFLSGECDALAADLSELAPIRADSPETFAILPELLSKEPLALLTHADDPLFAAVVDWTMNALIAAEELGIAAADANAPHDHLDPEMRQFLGLDPGNGAALGLRESWAADVIAAVGNYGEIYARNLGEGSAIQLPRGHNALWRDGGLLYALPMR